jgi:O-antigen/teichoic acid export membrane protein
MNKYLHAISANFIFFAANTLFFLVITPLALRVMGLEFYGLWAILYAIALFTNVGTLGITAITNKFSAEYNEDVEARDHHVLTSGFIIVTAMAVFVGALLLGTRNLIAGSINTSASMQIEFEHALFWVAIGLLPQFLTKVMQGYFLSQYRNSFVRSMEFLSSGLPWIGAVLLAVLQKTLVDLAVWFFVTQVLVFTTYLVALYMRIGYRFTVSGVFFRKMLDFSKFMFLELVAIASFQQVDRILVGFILGPAIAGVYAIGTSIGVRLPLITGQATEIMIPYASTKSSLGDHHRLYDAFRKMSQYIGVMAAGVGILLIVLMGDLLAIWISPAYATRYSDVFRIIVLAYSLLSLVRSGHQTLTGLGQVRFTSLTYFGATLVMLTILGAFSQVWGVLGAAIANLCMVLLLVFNFRVYQSFSKGKALGHFVQDLGMPVTLLLVAFGISLLVSSSVLRFVLVPVLWAPLLARVYRDKEFKLQLIRMIGRTTTEDA